MTRFAEEQRFSPAVVGATFALVAAAAILFAVVLPSEEPAGERLFTLSGLLIAPALIIAISAGFRLKTWVEAAHLTFGFPLGLRRTIPLEEIRSAEPVTYRPLRDFGGWGLRSGRMGVIYNARGNRAVRLSLVNGKVILVRSQRPDELAQVISSRR